MSPKSSSDNKTALVIVESPAKAKTINKYLGSGFKVLASMGHVRDLPGKSLAVDIENDFEPTYQIIPTRKKIVTEIRKAAKNAPMIYLAPDLDREGEAIAWHITEALKLKPNQYCRVVFNAITKDTIRQAFAHPVTLNFDKVNAQQARRILDRIVGYEISPLLWKKVARGLSAGRVQSVAVKIVVDREREIQAFVPEEFWRISGVFSWENNPEISKLYQDFLENQSSDAPPTQKQKAIWLNEHKSLEAELVSFAGEKFKPKDKDDAMQVFNYLHDKDFIVANIKTRRTTSKPPAPFITSTLQQQAANQLGYSTKNTMRTAQQLYEGIELGSKGSLGLITYMRTDSTNLSKDALDSTRGFIRENFGADYLPDKPNFYSSSNKSAQEAHEAIHPTDVNITPESIRDYLTSQQFKLYKLIWNRTVACQMPPAQWDSTAITITESENQKAEFRCTGRKLVFDGFMKVTGISSNGEQMLPQLSQQQRLWPVTIKPTQHFTSPPPRYTEASLVKTLEAEGIGRPSTYASIISTIQDRGYVEQIDRKFHATDLGIVVTDKLNQHFPRIMDLAFTSHMEEQLDKIEEQHLDWKEILREFYGPFKENLDRAHEEMKHAKAETQPSEYTCPDCGKPLVYRFGKNGRFLSCSNYPECKYASPCDRNGKIMTPEPSGYKCPNCGSDMILRKGRFGAFLGCSAYPECKTIQKIDKEGKPLPPKAPPEPSGIKCYKCDGELVIRQSKRGPFLGCGRFPKCRTIISIKQLDHLKELQQQGIWPPKTYEEADELLGRKKKKNADKDKSDNNGKEKTEAKKKGAVKK